MKFFLSLLFLFCCQSSFAQSVQGTSCQLENMEELTQLMAFKNWVEAQSKIQSYQQKLDKSCWEYRFLGELYQLTGAQIPKEKIDIQALELDFEYGKSSLAKDHVLLMTAATLYGVVLGAYTFGIMTETSEQVGVPLSIALGGVGLYSSYRWIKSEPKKTNMGIAFTSGLVIAPIYTSLIFNDQLSKMDGKPIATILMTSSTLGGVMMSYWASQKNVSSGDVYLLDSNVIWANLLTLYLRDVFDVSDAYITESHAIGTTIGLASGFASSYFLNWSAKKVGLINLGGLAGGLVAFGLSTLFRVQSDMENTILTLGAIAGLGSGIYLTDDVE